MNRFAIASPSTLEQAVAQTTRPNVKLALYKAGGMDVVDHLKEGLIEPDLLINLRTLRDGSLREIASGRIGALATLAEIAESSVIRAEAPVLARSVEFAATPQVRNVATAAGSLLQRPRCWYYRNDQFDCLKKGGPVCYAVEGENRYHAIFTDGPCHIVHPSNLALGLMVCRGAVTLTGAGRESLPIADLYHGPAKDVRTEHELKLGEIITGITFSAAPTSGFYAVKEKQSFDWPLVMAATAIVLDGPVIKSASVAVGAVAPVPMRLPAIERALVGVSVDDEDGLRRACADAAAGAKPLRDNAYKLKLLPVAVRRAVLRAAGKPLHD
jgi:xanthine dehydrogenase YagS FAD-binding subunit